MLPLKVETVQASTDTLVFVVEQGKWKPQSIEADVGAEFLFEPFSNKLKVQNIKPFDQYTSQSAAFAELVNRTIWGENLERPVFGSRVAI